LRFSLLALRASENEAVFFGLLCRGPWHAVPVDLKGHAMAVNDLLKGSENPVVVNIQWLLTHIDFVAFEVIPVEANVEDTLSGGEDHLVSEAIQTMLSHVLYIDVFDNITVKNKAASLTTFKFLLHLFNPVL